MLIFLYLQVDLTGGYYDAGDNVKFGFPLAFSSTMLAWSVLEFGGMMKGELQHARDAVRWGADYLLKATSHPDTVYVQVLPRSRGICLCDDEAATLFCFLVISGTDARGVLHRKVETSHKKSSF